jgi:hypothetical protein
VRSPHDPILYSAGIVIPYFGCGWPPAAPVCFPLKIQNTHNHQRLNFYLFFFFFFVVGISSFGHHGGRIFQSGPAPPPSSPRPLRTPPTLSTHLL